MLAGDAAYPAGHCVIRRTGTRHCVQTQAAKSLPVIPVQGDPVIRCPFLVFSVEYGSFRMLLTGDIGADEERGLLKAGLGGEDSKGAVSILKAAHHGSSGSSCGEFLEAIRPAAAILSDGEGNSYGHPAGETVKRLDRQGCSLWHTARSGAIRARTDGKTMRISGWLAVGRRRLSGFVVTVQPPG